MPFEFAPCSIPGLLVVTPRVFADERGAFLETYKESEFVAEGIFSKFVQDNHSISSRGTLRGLHYQVAPREQAKLVRVVRGSIWDVAVDIRPGSATYLRWEAIELAAANRLMFYIPPGFAHGFLALEDGTEVLYKCTAEYDKESERGVRWDDPDIAIRWPPLSLLLSEKDQQLPYLNGTRE